MKCLINYEVELPYIPVLDVLLGLNQGTGSQTDIVQSIPFKELCFV